MADPLDLPTPYSELVDAEGRPLQELLELLAKIKESLDDHEARLDAGGL